LDTIILIGQSKTERGEKYL